MYIYIDTEYAFKMQMKTHLRCFQYVFFCRKEKYRRLSILVKAKLFLIWSSLIYRGLLAAHSQTSKMELSIKTVKT